MSDSRGQEGPGRPPISKDTVQKLISSFQDGLNVTQACWQANIGRTTYYEYFNNDPEFKNTMERAREFVSMNARKVVVNHIKKGDKKASQWWLERRSKDEFATRQEVTGRNGQPLIEALAPDEKEKLDKIFARKHGGKPTTSESPAGDDQPVDQPGGPSEGESVS